MTTRAVAAINLSALKHNLQQVKEIAPHQLILAMIKSNAYGHGLLRVAKTLSEADAFGVACIEEALILREAGIKTPIVVMRGFIDEIELRQLVRYNLSAVIHEFEQLRLLERVSLPSPLSVWLKIDTGMNRLGFSTNQVPSVYQRLQRSFSVQKPIGLMTHLADADNSDPSFTEFQINQFIGVTEKMKGCKSIVNSAGLFAYPDALFDCIRPGIILYGVSPFGVENKIEKKFRPVMTLSAKVIAVKQCRKGEKIGYGCLWYCPEDMPIAIVGIGYGDGYPRHAASGTPTLLKKKICPVVGRVSMDMIMIDLRAQPNACVGDDVILWGDGLPIEVVAKQADTVGYQLLCNITQRVRFIEVENDY